MACIRCPDLNLFCPHMLDGAGYCALFADRWPLFKGSSGCHSPGALFLHVFFLYLCEQIVPAQKPVSEGLLEI